MSKEKEQLIKEKADEFDKQLTYVKIDLLKNQNSTFLTGEVFKKPINFVPDLPVPTAGANGKEIFIDPDCWIKATRPKRLGVIFHEGFHNMMGHCDTKAKTKGEHQLWNIAMDCVTEACRVTSGIGEQVDEAAIKPTNEGNVKLKINNVQILLPRCHEKSHTEIFDVLRRHVEKNPQDGGDGHLITDEKGNPIGDMDNHDLKEFTPEERAEMEQNLRQALVEHKLRGTLPGGVAGMIERMLKGKINWRAELRDMVMPEMKSYQSFSKVNRRNQSLGINLPGMIKEGLDVVAGWDTSSSIGQKEIELMVGNTAEMFNQFESGAVRVKLLFHHTEVYQELNLKDVHEMKKFKIQSGGTCHLDLFEKAEEANAKVLICFTDGHSSFPTSTKIPKVLWIVTDKRGMELIPNNLGKKIYVPIEDLMEA